MWSACVGVCQLLSYTEFWKVTSNGTTSSGKNPGPVCATWKEHDEGDTNDQQLRWTNTPLELSPGDFGFALAQHAGMSPNLYEYFTCPSPMIQQLLLSDWQPKNISAWLPFCYFTSIRKQNSWCVHFPALHGTSSQDVKGSVANVAPAQQVCMSPVSLLPTVRNEKILWPWRILQWHTLLKNFMRICSLGPIVK
jgi:hypothetical protein